MILKEQKINIRVRKLPTTGLFKMLAIVLPHAEASN